MTGEGRGYLLFLLLVGLGAGLDLALNQAGATIFLARKLFDLVDYLAFWN